jgi:NTP pyrophosphatase (non-canonical NTP hydrolase)
VNRVFKMQALLQEGYQDMPDPSKLSGTATVGMTVDYIQQMSFYLSEEVSELIQEISGGNRNAMKPWSVEYSKARNASFVTTPHVRSEAIDILCFAINICLAAGIKPDDINAEYDKVLTKNVGRQHDEEY